ncbi:MAG: hypothetical protein QW678_00260 [Candidatus Aenigmatarchaeota archaeon]
MEEKIIKEIIIPKEEYLEFNIETSNPLNAYKRHYEIFARMLEIKRSRHYIRDLRFDATDNSFFIRIDISDIFDDSKFFRTYYLIETILSGNIPKEGKSNLNIKLRGKIIYELTISDENKLLFFIKKLFAHLHFQLFYKKVFEDRIKRIEEVLEKAKNEFIRILS